MASTTGDFNELNLFLADARLALGVANTLRYQALAKAFGVSREQANVLTFVILVGAGDILYVGAKQLARAPISINRGDAVIGALALREGALSLAGPGVRAIPGLGALMALGLLGGVVLPRVRRAIRRFRETEHRLRAERIRRYNEARRRMTS
jgi:hypothetical protein